MTRTLIIDYDDEVLLSVGMSPEEFSEAMKFKLAAELYGEGKLTAGQSAKLCGKDKVDFLHELPRRGYPMSNLGAEDFREDLEFAHGE